MYISSRHATFSFDAAKGIFSLIDHASTNGVFLNGTRIAPEAATPVRGGDVVVFGGGGRCKVGRRLPQPRSAYRYTVVVKAADLIEERNIPQQNRIGFGGENCNAGNVGSPSRRFSGSQIEAPGAAQQRLIARLQADLAAKAAEAAELQEKVRAETEAADALRADLVAKAAEAAELKKKVKAEAEAAEVLKADLVAKEAEAAALQEKVEADAAAKEVCNVQAFQGDEPNLSVSVSGAASAGADARSANVFGGGPGIATQCEELYECVVCFGTLVYALNLPCSHVLCHGCWCDWSEADANGAGLESPVKCPTCNREVSDPSTISRCLIADQAAEILMRTRGGEEEAAWLAARAKAKPRIDAWEAQRRERFVGERRSNVTGRGRSGSSGSDRGRGRGRGRGRSRAQRGRGAGMGRPPIPLWARAGGNAVDAIDISDGDCTDASTGRNVDDAIEIV
jgi:hypothetical protein